MINLENAAFVVGLGLGYGLLLWWSSLNLPREKWQIFAVVPGNKNEHGWFSGTNFTYYGFFQAMAFTVALLLVLVMLGSVHHTFLEALSLIIPLLLICVPASRWVARIVEKKSQTFTVAGASFVGLILVPWYALAWKKLFGGPEFSIMPVLAAVAVGYAWGEGLGRLACISFGCCYGKPLSQCSAPVRRIFEKHCFVFTGASKKISYASGLEGTPVLPIQAITSAILTGSGLLGLYLFLGGWFKTTFVLILAITQAWRVYSETLRADYRGGGKLSAYQWMSLISIVYALALTLLLPYHAIPLPELTSGLSAIWNPAVLLTMQFIWLGAMIYYGQSKVTASEVKVFVVQDRI